MPAIVIVCGSLPARTNATGRATCNRSLPAAAPHQSLAPPMIQMPEPMIRLEQVCKSYDRQVQAVSGLDLCIERGMLVALLGPSGCGKTTTLRLLAGLEQPDQGRIWLAGQYIAAPHVWVAPEHRQIGMVFQDYALFPHLSIGDNIAFPLTQQPPATRRQRIHELLDMVGLAGMERRYPHQLSGGQQQRVALARALAANPLVVLLDEPFSNLDAALRKSTRSEVRRILKQSGTTTLFVTHDQEEAFTVADRVVVMFHGKIAQVGTPRQIYLQPATRQVASFVGEASFLPATAHGSTASTVLGTVPLATPLHGAIETLVRPEAVQVQQVAADEVGHGVIERVEFSGAHQSLSVRCHDGTLLLARIPPDQEYVAGAAVRLRLTGAVAAWQARPQC